jgi:hypothetical protein
LTTEKTNKGLETKLMLTSHRIKVDA